MKRITSHEQGIYTVDVDYYRPNMAASHMIIEDARVAFVDVGTSHSVSQLLAALESVELTPEQVDLICVTHIHLDHAGGAGALMRVCPNAKCVVHPRGARHLIDPSKLIAGSTAVFGQALFEQLYGDIVPIDADRVIAVEDNQEITLSGRQLKFIDTPGHAKHHYCIVDAQSRSIFTGDTFGVSYREFDVGGHFFIFPTTTPVQFDPDALHHSIDRLMQYNPSQAFLTHYGRVAHCVEAANKLHTMIDTFVDIALLNQAVDNRGEMMTRDMMNYLLDVLRETNDRMDAAKAEALLAMDVKLNVQGLEVWLDKQVSPT